MRGLYLPGGRRVELRDVADPTPGSGEVVVQVRASTICGSDLRAIYREHLGTGAEAYQDVIAGHEPCGEVVAVGPDCRVRQVGDRVVVYHISGCGVCADCRRGYQISCTSDLRRAYGWQRDGGHADYLLAEERDLIPLPDALSYVDGACVACGFGTAYEAVRRGDVSGADTVLVTGLGPVGQAIGLLAHALGAPLVVGTDPNSARREAALRIGAVDVAADATDDAVRAALPSGADAAFDASGVGTAQQQALRHTNRWGRCVLVGEGGTMDLEVSRDLIHRQVTMIGSWVTSTVRMAELVDRLVRWELHPEIVVTHRCALTDGADAYRTADEVVGGKVAILPASSRRS